MAFVKTCFSVTRKDGYSASKEERDYKRRHRTAVDATVS